MTMPRLKERYLNEVHGQLLEELSLDNAMRVPRFEKIVVNMGVGEAVADGKLIDGAVADLTVITGQKPRVNKARKSIAIPRIRDFRGLNPKSFDGNGNYTFGVTEQLIFPEVDYDKVGRVRGMDITICTTAEDDDGGRALLTAFGFPFRRQQAGV